MKINIKNNENKNKKDTYQNLPDVVTPPSPAKHFVETPIDK